MTRESRSDSEESSGSNEPRDREGSEEPTATSESSENASGAAASSESRSGSKKSSGERSEPRDSEDEAERSPRKGERGADATREPSDSSEPNDSEASSDSNDSRDDLDSVTQRPRTDEDDVPLQIVGHEERDRAGGSDVVAFDEDGPNTANEESETDSDEETVEPVEVLVGLAKDGEIDPWDIDVVRVTDKFLEAIDRADLRTSGRALFYASVLIRMKSDELFTPDEPDEEELPPWEAPFADEGAMDADDSSGGFDPVVELEAEMDRRLERKHARGKPETLDELVRELRDAERGTWWKNSRRYDTSESPKGWDRGVQELHYHDADDARIGDEPTAHDVTHTTHEEDIEDVIDDVEAALLEQYDQGRSEVLYAEIDEVGGSRVFTYLALLFLAHRGRVRLEQDDLFGDLWIQQVTVEAEPEGAVAD